jgi:hypothetical protein
VSDVDGGTLCEAARLAGVRVGAGVRVCVAARVPGGRMLVDVVKGLGFGVTLSEEDGRRDFFCDDGAGVLIFEAGFGCGTEASDIGGDGGS